MACFSGSYWGTTHLAVRDLLVLPNLARLDSGRHHLFPLLFRHNIQRGLQLVSVTLNVAVLEFCNSSASGCARRSDESQAVSRVKVGVDKIRGP